MSVAIVSGAYGEKYLRMADVTWPNQRTYAKRIGASFHEISLRRYPNATPHWEKLQLRKFLGEFDRVMWLDCDVVIRADCPNLFEMVPKSMLGAWDESKNGPWNYPSFISRWAALLGITSPPYPGWHANTGVMVLSPEHEFLFGDPPGFPGYDLLWDQGWINFGAALKKTSLMDIGSRFNHMFIAPGDRFSSYIMHYCGTVNGSGYAKEIAPGGDHVSLIRSDLERWKS